MEDNNHIVLFDGVCNLCSGSVQWIIKHDKKGIFKFASLQSEAGEKLRREFQIPADVDSIIYIKNNIVLIKSAAALNIARHCGIWKLWYIFIVVPRFLRDWIYDIVAKNRYKWFGKKEICWIPTEDLKNRFLN